MKPAFLIILLALLFFSCKKESFITSGDAGLDTSADTLFFDTVFTTTGSITQSFKIFNNNDQKLRLSRVKLSGGASSPFKINVNGTAAAAIDDIEINANDSIYVFAQVNINPSDATLPFIVRDSIMINYNGNTKWVQLQAYGQNAIFLKKTIVTRNVTWKNKLPYVILGGLTVDTNAILTISAGTKIFLHADAPFLIDGTLLAKGTKEQPVIFSGDRTDEDYKYLPASWPGIYFRNTSKNNYLRHTHISNANQGIVAKGKTVTARPRLTLSQCIIENSYDAGISGINAQIHVDNSLIYNCRKNIQLELGGDYRFVNCTVASYGNSYIVHEEAVLQVSNFSKQEATNFTAPLSALFRNCIFWGDGGMVEDEISVSKQGDDPFSVTFDHILYKAKNDIADALMINSVKNITPQFDSINVTHNIYNFHFNNMPAAPAVNAGVVTAFPVDLDDKPRDAFPDIGCYER